MNQPAQLAGRRRVATLDALQGGLQQPMPPSVSIRNAMFALVDAAGVEVPLQLFDPQFGRYIDVVIIGVNPKKSREYYDKPYDPDVPMAPACFSDNGIGASAAAISPQSLSCELCPQAVWGSKTSQKSGKGIPACSTKKKLAVIACNDPHQIAYQFKIPPASLKNVTNLAQLLSKQQVTDAEGQRPCDPADVVTRVYFDPQHQGELLFYPLGFHEQMYPYVAQLIEHIDSTGSIDFLIGAKDQPYQGAIALPNPQVMQSLPAPAQQTQAPPPPAPVQAVPQFQTVPQGANGNGGFQPQPTQAFAPPQQPQQAAPQAGPPPRTRRGGARAGAGRPLQQEAAQQAPQPTQAPFQQPAPQPAQQFVAAPPTPAAQPVPFQPQAAQPFTGQVPQQSGQQPVPETPAFLQRNADNTMAHPGPMATSTTQPGGAPAFGMTNGAQPDPALAAALQNAFGAPIPPRQR